MSLTREPDLGLSPLDLVLEVGGLTFRRFLRASVLDSLDAGSVTFRLELVPPRPFPFELGQEVSLRVGRELLARGHVETLEGSSDLRQGTTVVLEGRSMTGDLVDCSPLDAPSEFRDEALPDIARALLAPHGIELVDELNARQLGPAYHLNERFRLFRVQPGESSWEALDRLARQRGVLLHGRGDGALELTVGGLGGDPGARILDLYGEPPSNVVGSRLRLSQVDRFSRVVVRGQGPGDDLAWGEAVAHVEGEAADPSVRRYRPLLVVAQRPVDLQSARDLAEWEAVVRRSRGTGVEVELAGWHTDPRAGKLWRVNVTPRVDLAPWNLSGRFLVQAAQYLIDPDQGYTVRLSLVPPDALDRLAELTEADRALEGLLEEWKAGDAEGLVGTGELEDLGQGDG